MDPFVSPEWLLEHRDDVVIADLRWYLDEDRDGHDEYLQSHVSGAVFVDLERDLVGEPSAEAGRHPLPEPEDFAAAMSALGVGDDDQVVVYDQGHGAVAARMVWMLRITGHDAAVLDGGWAAWEGPTASGEEHRDPASFSARSWPAHHIVDAPTVAHLASGHGLVLDARDADRYAGVTEPIDARPGHIPGAVSRPYEDNLDKRGNLLGPVPLRARYALVGALDGQEVAVYCGSGVTACHDILALETFGIQAKLYPGSWSAWSADESNPVATGPNP